MKTASFIHSTSTRLLPVAPEPLPRRSSSASVGTLSKQEETENTEDLIPDLRFLCGLL
jgi:hypothetical protein